MPVTPFSEAEIPRFRRANLDNKMQGFVDKLTTTTIPEINDMVASTAVKLSPKFIDGDTSFPTSTNPKDTIQTYYVKDGVNVSITFPDADVVHDLSTFEDQIIPSPVTLFSKSIVTVWWNEIGSNIHAYLIREYAGAEALGIGGGGGFVLPEPEYDIVDTPSSLNYIITDY